jgi:hypothetical protein
MQIRIERLRLVHLSKPGPTKKINRQGAKSAKISWYFFLATLAPWRF